MKFHERLRTRRSWTHFFTCVLCDEEGNDLRAEACCGVPGDLWGLGVLLEGRTCWVRYVIVVSLLSFVGRKTKSCENLSHKEYDCRNLTEAIENEKKCCKVTEELNKFPLSNSKKGTHSKGLLQVECAGNSNMKLANTCSSHLIGTVECNAQSYPEETQNRRLTLETCTQNPNTDLSERTTCTEPTTPTGQELYTDDYERDPYCHLITTREIASYDPCYCYPNPCVCNYNPRKTMGWGPDYYSRYSRNVGLDMGRNEDWRRLCQYEANRTYSQGYYTPKSNGRYDVQREDSIEFLYSRADKTRVEKSRRDPKLTSNVENFPRDPKLTPYVENFPRDPKLASNVENFTRDPKLTANVENFPRDPKLTRSPKRQQQFEPKHHSTRNETQTISDSSPLRYSPERSQYQGTAYVDDENRVYRNTTHREYPRSKKEYVVTDYDQRIDNVPTNGKVNASTRTETDHNSRVDRILQKETATNHIQVQTDDVAIFSTTDEIQPQENQVLLQNKKNHGVVKASKERQNTINNKTLAKADPNSAPNEYEMGKAGEKMMKIVKHHADSLERSQVENTSQELSFTTGKNQRPQTEVKKPLKIKMHDQKKSFYPFDESKVQKYVSVKTNTDSPLSTAIETEGNIPHVRLCPRNCEQNQKTFGKTHDCTTLKSLSDDSKHVTASTGETISSVTTDVSMDVNLPDNIKPQQRSKSKRQSPVNIELKNCVPLYIEDPLTWYSYGDIPLSMTISNWNDTITISGEWNDREVPRISGGPLLNDVYTFDKLLLKWGACDHTGSEHATDGKFYPLERQMVFRRDTQSVYSMELRPRNCNNPNCNVTNCRDLQHRGLKEVENLMNCSRPSVMSSADKVKGMGNSVSEEASLEYVIISSFYDIFDCDPYSRNVYLDKILKFVKYVQYPNTFHLIPIFTLDMIQEPFNCNYYCYFGSMTVPPYRENVLWIIHPDISFVSKQQMASLREIKSENGENVLSNRRTIQPLNERCIYLVC